MYHSTQSPLSSDASDGIRAIYRDAYNRGCQDGFTKGIAEKIWLHKHWPALLFMSCALSMLIGIIIMGSHQP